MIDRRGLVWLDANREGEGERSLFFANPIRTITADTPEEVPGVLDALDAATQENLWAAGYLAYEAGYGFIDLPPGEHLQQPLAWFGLFEAPLSPPIANMSSRRAKRGEISAGGDPSHTFGMTSWNNFSIHSSRLGIDQSAYRERIGAIKTHIEEGDVYQINFTDRLTFDFDGDPLAFYHALRERQQTPYGAFIDTGNRQILSLSPELFFRRENAHILTRPMKGTAAPGSFGEDNERRRTLAADEKNRAENLMIVDLLRNDLSRICRPGSVRVQQLFETERYETVIQMSSSIEGRLREDATYGDIFPALFPCGSVTGAPKRRAMEIIQTLEPVPRDVYCGAIGYVTPDERAVFNVAIRTVVLEGNRGWMGTGSGIVWDSDAAEEYEECLLKTEFLTRVHHA